MRAKSILILGFVGSLGLAAIDEVRADEITRKVQQALKEQQFYSGAVDGNPSAETAAAIKRYQIRNGLEPTGTLTDDTLKALDLAEDGSGEPESSPSTEPKPAEPKPQTGPQSGFGGVPPAGPDSKTYPPKAPIDDYARFFERTPYQTAPRQVQVATVRNLQAVLAKSGRFWGKPDGIPGPSLQKAVIAYQKDSGLVPSGRADLETLSRMRLLPGKTSTAPLKPFYAPGSQPQQPRVYRGILVE